MADIQAVDVHAHFGTYHRDGDALKRELMSANPETVLARAEAASTVLTIVSPLHALMPRDGADPVAGNASAEATVGRLSGIGFWVVVDPLKPETFEQAETMLRSPRCAGIKMHPEEHGYQASEHGEAVFQFAAGQRAVVLSHSGDPNSMPGPLVAFADRYPEMRLILAHLGHGWDGDLSHQVRATQAARHPNVYVDTSSICSVVSGLLEWAVREVGSERILYGTDSPLYFAPMQRARIDRAEISDESKSRILRGNAEALFDLSALGGGRP